MPHRLKYLLQTAEWAAVGSLLLKFLYWVFTFLSPIQEALGAVCFMVLVNLITGLVAMKRRGDKFSFPKLAWSFSKFFLFTLVIIAGYVLEILVPGIPFARLLAGFMGVMEGESIGSNFNRIYGYNVLKAVKLWILSRNSDWSEVKEQLRSEYTDPKSRPPSVG